MSFAKIPFIILNIGSAHITYTSPTLPPKESELIDEGVKLAYFAPFCEAGLWLLGIAEMAVILASQSPWSPISQYAINLLFRNGDVQHIRLTSVSIFGVLLSTLGSILRLHCYQTMGKQFTFRLSIRDDHKLVMDGPYTFVRHPSYTGLIMMIAGTICYHVSLGSWLRESYILDKLVVRLLVTIHATIVFTPFFVLRNRMLTEDAALLREFGKDWEQWAKEVPYWLIPGIY